MEIKKIINLLPLKIIFLKKTMQDNLKTKDTMIIILHRNQKDFKNKDTNMLIRGINMHLHLQITRRHNYLGNIQYNRINIIL